MGVMRVIQDSDDEAEDLEVDPQPSKSAAAPDASVKQASDNNASSASTGNSYSL